LLKLAEVDTTLPDAAKTAVKVLAAILGGIEKAIDDLEGQIADAHARSDMNRLLARVPVSVSLSPRLSQPQRPIRVFRSGRDFAAWLGLTPRQNSSGGKQTLGGITKKGNRYIRKLLVLSATSLLRSVSKRKGALADWISALLAKKPARLVTVALANKLARIIWAIMRTGEIFRAEIFAKA
jgi:transposase